MDSQGSSGAELVIGNGSNDDVSIVVDGVCLTIPRALAGTIGGYLIAAAHGPLPAEARFEVERADHEDPTSTAQASLSPVPAPPTVPLHMPAAAEASRAPVTAHPAASYTTETGKQPESTHPLVAYDEPDVSLLSITQKARDTMGQHGITEADIADALTAPVSVSMANYGNVLVFESERAIALVPMTETHIVIGAARSTILDGVQRAKSGGPGRKGFGTREELVAALRGHGFEVDLTRGSGHPAATHPDHPDVVIFFPATPSDGRSYLNVIAQVRRVTGIDITTN